MFRLRLVSGVLVALAISGCGGVRGPVARGGAILPARSTLVPGLTGAQPGDGSPGTASTAASGDPSAGRAAQTDALSAGPAAGRGGVDLSVPGARGPRSAGAPGGSVASGPDPGVAPGGAPGEAAAGSAGGTPAGGGPPSPGASASSAPGDSMPARWSLTVPYTPQAPYNNWSERETACEEAALLMTHDYLGGDTRADIPADEADAALAAMQRWQVANWGAERDLTMTRTGQLAAAYYGHGYKVQAATPSAIMAAVRAGSPVSVPVMTHALENPHYGPKDVYHVLLIVGYNENGIIANDAGVMQGKGWAYSWPILFRAMDAQTLENQGRVMLTLSR